MRDEDGGEGRGGEGKKEGRERKRTERQNVEKYAWIVRSGREKQAVFQRREKNGGRERKTDR